MRVFITGATGYLGGEILHTLIERYPSASFCALVRDAAQGEVLKNKYRQVSPVVGDLDTEDVIKSEASNADVVINAASNKHIPSVENIAAGFQSSKRSKPGHLIQISGASVLSAKEAANKTFGEPSQKQYDDLEGAQEILDLIQKTSSRALDRAVLDQSRKHPGKINTALVFAPLIYGRGQGTGNTESIQLPGLCKIAIQKHQSVYVGKGEAQWGNVHVADVGHLLASLVDAAGASKNADQLWNDSGLYFVQTSEMTWKSIAEKVAEASLVSGSEAESKSVSSEEIEQVFPAGSLLLGTNARGKSERGQKLLGFKSTQHSLAEEIPYTFKRISKAQ